MTDQVACRFFLQNRCNRGEQCRFSHGAGAAESPPTPATRRRLRVKVLGRRCFSVDVDQPQQQQQQQQQHEVDPHVVTVLEDAGEGGARASVPEFFDPDMPVSTLASRVLSSALRCNAGELVFHPRGVVAVQEEGAGTPVMDLILWFLVDVARSDGAPGASFDGAFCRLRDVPCVPSALADLSMKEDLLRRAVVLEEAGQFGPQPRGLDFVSFVIATRSGADGVTSCKVGGTFGDDEEILLVEERSGKLFLPAGHVENKLNEDFAGGARRESLEEAGVQVEVSTVSDIIFGLGIPELGGYSPLHVVFGASSVVGEPKSVPDHESRSASWFNLRQTLVLLAQQMDEEQGEGAAERKMGHEWGRASRPAVEPLRYQFRKAWEIGPMIARFVRRRGRGSLAPLL